MADNDNAAVKNETLNNSSQSNDNTSSEMLKPFMKTLGKEFYHDEEIGKLESLQDLARGYKRRVEPKVTPDEYGYGEDDEVFKKVGLTKEEADLVSDHFSKKTPKGKDHQEVFGDDYEVMEKQYSKAVGTFANDLLDEIKSNGLDRQPVFAKVMARIGKELGSANFNPASTDGRTANAHRDVYAEIRNKGKK